MKLVIYLRRCVPALIAGCMVCLLVGCVSHKGKTAIKVQPQAASKVDAKSAAPVTKGSADGQESPKAQAPARELEVQPQAVPKVDVKPVAPVAKGSADRRESSKSQVPARELKVALLSEAEAVEFKALLRKRSEIQKDWSTMERYRREKATEAATLEQTLSSQYGMDASREYRYNSTNHTIYLVWPLANGKTKLLPHRRFPTESEESQYKKIMVAKSAARKQADAFEAYMAGKAAEAEQIAATLQAKFGVDSAKQYRYDDARRELWEILPPLPGPDDETGKKVEKKDVAPQTPAPAPASMAKPSTMSGDPLVQW